VPALKSKVPDLILKSRVSGKDEWHQWTSWFERANAPPPHEGPSLAERSPSGSSASNSADSVSFCDGDAVALKLWNESGTKRARIADSSRNLIRSPQHLALKHLTTH
jgi:hypothetical protein